MLVAAALLAGAEAKGCPADREVAVRVVASGVQCGGWGAGISARRLASAEEVGAATGSAPPPADFAKEAVILVATGRKPTAGFGIALATEWAPVKGGVATIRVALASPAPGTMNAQVVTSPCIIVALPADGLDAVVVVEGERLVARVPLR
jgi:hypothetical protein